MMQDPAARIRVNEEIVGLSELTPLQARGSYGFCEVRDGKIVSEQFFM
jgi:hypothetical protein